MTTTRQQIIAREWVKAQRLLTGYLHAALGDFEQVEELAQRIAMVAVERAEDYDPDRPFVPWLLGIARYELLRFRRDLARDRHTFDSDMIDRLSDAYVRSSDELQSMEHALRLCLHEVSERARSILELRYRDALSTRQIALQVESTDGAIRALLKRTRQLLKDCIQRRLHAEQSP